MRTKAWQVSLVVLAILLVTILHLLTPLDRLILHQIYQRLYYLPIVAAAFLFGWRGGLAAAALASATYLPHIFFHWHHTEYNYALNQYAEITLFLLVGGVIGLLGDQNRRERRRAEEINAELQKAYSELRQTVSQLLQAERLSSLGEIAAGVVHEIRNPLGAIRGAVEIMEDELAAGSPRREFAAIAKSEVERLNKIVGEFLHFARPAKPEKKIINVNEIVHSVRHLIEQQALAQNVSLEENLAENLPLVLLDAEQIKQILLNLAINSLQAMSNGGKLTFQTFADDKNLAVSVTDTGGGIDDSIIDKIFDPFFTTKEKGLGLGLSVAFRIAQQHGAVLQARNKDDGAVFILSLPTLS